MLAGRFAPNTRTRCAVVPDFTDNTSVPLTGGSLDTLRKTTSRPVSSYGPVNQRPVISLALRSMNATSRHVPGSSGASADRPRHWNPVYTIARLLRVTDC